MGILGMNGFLKAGGGVGVGAATLVASVFLIREPIHHDFCSCYAVGEFAVGEGGPASSCFSIVVAKGLSISSFSVVIASMGLSTSYFSIIALAKLNFGGFFLSRALLVKWSGPA